MSGLQMQAGKHRQVNQLSVTRAPGLGSNSLRQRGTQGLPSQVVMAFSLRAANRRFRPNSESGP